MHLRLDAGVADAAVSLVALELWRRPLRTSRTWTMRMRMRLSSEWRCARVEQCSTQVPVCLSPRQSPSMLLSLKTNNRVRVVPYGYGTTDTALFHVVEKRALL